MPTEGTRKICVLHMGRWDIKKYLTAPSSVYGAIITEYQLVIGRELIEMFSKRSRSLMTRAAAIGKRAVFPAVYLLT